MPNLVLTSILSRDPQAATEDLNVKIRAYEERGYRTQGGVSMQAIGGTNYVFLFSVLMVL